MSQIKQGAPVVTENGKEVGKVDRIVIDPGSKEVTHVVVRRGGLFSADKVVPMELVITSTEDRVIVRGTEHDLDGVRDFEETHFVPLTDAANDVRSATPEGYAQPYYWYPPIGTAWWGYPGYQGYPNYPAAPYAVDTEKNIPDHTVALKEGAKVISADGADVGEIERVFTDTKSDRATHILIAEGLIFKNKKLLPTTWIADISEDDIRLRVDAELVDRLNDYAE